MADPQVHIEFPYYVVEGVTSNPGSVQILLRVPDSESDYGMTYGDRDAVIEAVCTAVAGLHDITGVTATRYDSASTDVTPV